MKEILKSKRPIIAQAINDEIDFLEESFRDAHPLAVEAMQEARELATAGKLVRGIMVYQIGDILGVDSAALLKAAVAIELSHTAILAQDDIMDQDDLRRGVASMHARYRKKALKDQLHQPSRYGESQAVSISDILFFHAFSLLAQAGVQTDSAIELIATYSKRFIDCGIGQLIDVHITHAGQATELDIQKTHEYKTASYTFSAPAEIACVLADRTDLKPLVADLGYSLGMIYQLVDDNFAYISSDEEAGKDVSSDIKEGKQTLQMLLLYQKADTEQSEFLDSVFGNSDASDDDIIELRKLSQDLDLQKIIDSRIKALSNKASEDIVSLPNELMPFYQAVLDFNLERRK